MIDKYKIEQNEVINTFIITTFNDKYIFRCLDSLVKTIDRDKHRIILIEGPNQEDNNCLYEKTKDIVDVYIRTKRNYGFEKSVNMGIMMSHTPYFTIVHDDCWFIHNGWWDVIKEDLASGGESLLMLQPQQRNSKHTLGRDLLGNILYREPVPLPDNPTEEQYNKMLAEATTASLGEVYCMVFKREFVDKVGYLNEKFYPLGPVDIELFYRSGVFGYRIAISNRAIIYHEGTGASKAGESKHSFNCNGYIDKEKLVKGEIESPLIRQL